MFLYEMHQHTTPCSHCGRADPVKLVYALKEAGFAGVVLTNHFYHGNTGIDRDLPWEDFVRAYEEDYLKAKKAGDEIGIDVIFGVEEHVGNGKEILLYGITPEMLYAHPECADGKLETISNAMHEYGALVFQAHPYRSRAYIIDPSPLLNLDYLDGIEAYNGCNPEDENIRAEQYAKENGKLMCAGSDAHGEEFENRFGIACEHRIRNAAELIETLKSGDYKLYLG